MNKRERSPVCHIVGAGDFEPSLIPPRGSGDLLIAADAGFLSLQKAGLTPDLYIGDGDSLGFLPRGVDTVVLPKVKDDTDTLFQDHINEASKALSDDQPESLTSALGKHPRDLPDVICELALAAPGTCALRALCRVADDDSYEFIDAE